MWTWEPCTGSLFSLTLYTIPVIWVLLIHREQCTQEEFGHGKQEQTGTECLYERTQMEFPSCAKRVGTGQRRPLKSLRWFAEGHGMEC